MDTSLILKTVNSQGKAQQKTVTFANSAASSANLKIFAQKLNALTTDTYVGTSRIDKTDLDNGGSE